MVTNFGWALAPQPNIIPTDGSTIGVYIDGALRGHPTYNQFRGDIASLFPGYENSSGAVGFFVFDSTTLTNGVHTISWSVTDNAGHTSGIGSRYFTVANGVSSFVAGSSVRTADRAALTDASTVPPTERAVNREAGQTDSADTTIPPFGVVDSPSDDARVTGRIVVSGWALDLADVPVRVDLLVDGVVVGRAHRRQNRPDVCAAYPFVGHCSGSHPGFEIDWDPRQVAEGVHSIAVRVLDPALGLAIVGERQVIVSR
jgi:hypothetical protein